MAWSRIQGLRGDNQGGGLTVASSAGSAVGSGNLIVGYCTWGSGVVGDLSSITDNASGNTYIIAKRVADTTAGQSAACFYCINVVNGPTVLTEHLGTSLNCQIIWEEFTNAGVSGATLNGSAQGQLQPTPGTGADAVKTGTAVGASGDLVWGVAFDNTGAAPTISKNASFTAGFNGNADASFFGASTFMEWIAATGSVDPSFTISVAASMISLGMAFSISGGGPTGWGRALAGEQNMAVQ